MKEETMMGSDKKHSATYIFFNKVVANASLDKNKNCKNTLNADINFFKTH
jgi:hypothetical protein